MILFVLMLYYSISITIDIYEDDDAQNIFDLSEAKRVKYTSVGYACGLSTIVTSYLVVYRLRMGGTSKKLRKLIY